MTRSGHSALHFVSYMGRESRFRQVLSRGRTEDRGKGHHHHESANFAYRFNGQEFGKRTQLEVFWRRTTRGERSQLRLGVESSSFRRGQLRLRYGGSRYRQRSGRTAIGQWNREWKIEAHHGSGAVCATGARPRRGISSSSTEKG